MRLALAVTTPSPAASSTGDGQGIGAWPPGSTNVNAEYSTATLVLSWSTTWAMPVGLRILAIRTRATVQSYPLFLSARPGYHSPTPRRGLVRVGGRRSGVRSVPTEVLGLRR